MDALYLQLLNTVFKGQLNGIDIPTATDTAKTFMKGVFEGYGGDFTTFEYNSPDYTKLAHIEANVYQFSGAKNWHMLRDLTDALKEGDRVLPFREFKTKAETILGEYQGNWLRTEYNTAIAGSQMASKWVQFEKYPEGLLQYRTMDDDRVRADHRPLHLVMRPVNDAFWKTYYPPNGWGCRCTVIKKNEGRPTLERNIEYPDVPRLFQTNLGKSGLVFPKGSAYFIGIPDNVKQQINNNIPDRSNPKKQ